MRSFLALLTGCLSVVLPVAAGPLVRVANTTLKLPEVPGSFGYQLGNAFTGLTFSAPVAVATPPGETNRLFVVEQAGRIIVLPDLQSPAKETFLDISTKTAYGGEEGLLGLAFHPGYATNGRIFLYRTVTATTAGHTNQLHDRLSEFHVSAASTNRADAASEIILFQQADPASNHNAGDVHFGPDGYLYVSLGDGGGANNQFNNAQKIDAGLFAGLLRLDVDNRPDSLAPNPHPSVIGNYRIPADNPFVGATNFLGQPVDPAKVRTEYFAVGLRNPWRWSFDSANGDIWIGDVGQDRWENVFITRKGANHGWAFREGNIAGPYGMPTGCLTDPKFNYVPPLQSYAHGSGTGQGNSLTGGFVYRGARLAQLFGAYIYADYVSGNVWALRRQESGPPLITRLLGQTGIAAFGKDPRNGDILAVNVNSGFIQRLDYNPTFTGAPLPATLADTGALADTASLTPAAGFVAYSVNQPFWSDGAQKQRWFCVPDTAQHLGFTTNDAWASPNGTVWMKHFDLELTNGVPQSSRRLETRFIVRNSNGVYGVTYRWNSATNAVLVPEEGADELITRVINGVAQTQTWHYPSRAECVACHNAAAGHSLSFNTAQLNRPFTYPGGVTTNQIAALADAGYFTTPPTNLTPLAAVAAVDDESVSVEWRVRSYLAVNCSLCHRPGGSGGGFFDARLQTKTALAGLIDGRLNDPRGDTNNRVLVGGSPEHSVLLQRQSVRGAGQMPPLASNVPDAAGSALIQRWIAQLGDPFINDPATVQADAQNGKLRLHIGQPINQAVQVEATDSLLSPNWLRLDLPGTEPTYPAQSRELLLEVPLGDGPQFYRTRSDTP
ncbi:MAG TPA: PQQ-dependent sugar dehydrogenase [Candidatus Limnocylindria bacterium]|nr:PQQ-dependent sugar dehydrogenase [Candidatus Limnocylindria bacterium]